jgi:DNA polymerase-1
VAKVQLAAAPLWPTPPIGRVGSPASVARLASLLQAAAPSKLGVRPSGAGEGRVDPDDPRKARLRWLSLALPRDPDAPPEHPDKAPARAFLIDVDACGGPDALAPLAAAWSSAYVVFEQAQRDLAFLPPRLRPRRYGCVDTAVLLLDEGKGAARGLNFAARVERALGHALDVEGLPRGSGEERLAIAADVLVPLLAALVPMLRRRGLVRAYELELELLPAVLAMERAGVAVDAARFRAVARTWANERAQTHDPQRIARLDKLLSTYASWPDQHVDPDGRIRCRLHPMATDSGRFSCTDPNLQQVPGEHKAPGIRGTFRAPPGRALIVADYAQIELRVAAHLAPCDAMRQVFVAGRDPHRATAATLTGKPEAEITDHERKLAKAINFGFLFGMGARRFQDYAAQSYGLSLDAATAQRAHEAFFATYPGIAAWHRATAQLGERDGPRGSVVRTALGRRKRFAPRAFAFTVALNIPVQGTAAEGFKRAMTWLHARLPPTAAQVLCVHDELLVEAPLDQADELCALVRTTMEAAMAAIVTSVPIVVEAHVQPAWGASAGE